MIRDENGLVLGSCSKHLPQAYSAVEVEALAVATALALAEDLGMTWVILEGDSLVIIKALRKEEQFLSPIGLLLGCENVIPKFSKIVVFSYEKRKQFCSS